MAQISERPLSSVLAQTMQVRRRTARKRLGRPIGVCVLVALAVGLSSLLERSFFSATRMTAAGSQLLWDDKPASGSTSVPRQKPLRARATLRPAAAPAPRPQAPLL